MDLNDKNGPKWTYTERGSKIRLPTMLKYEKFKRTLNNQGQSMRILAFFIVSVFSTSLFAMNDNSSVENPSDAYKMHICAFHIAKDNPNLVIETQHYCTALHDGLFQCLLYETTKEKKPKLLGVEYVISDEIYQKLPAEEKKLWHPHDFEVRQGLLALIDATKAEDKETMKVLVKTWGKTWHTWPDPNTEIPLGIPRLMWSATKNGDVPEEMIRKRDERWNINTLQLKEERKQYLAP